jgi:hypothetical protein
VTVIVKIDSEFQPSRWSDFFDDLAVASNDDYADPEAHAAMLEAHAAKPQRAIVWMFGAFLIAAALGVFGVVA